MQRADQQREQRTEHRQRGQQPLHAYDRAVRAHALGQRRQERRGRAPERGLMAHTAQPLP